MTVPYQQVLSRRASPFMRWTLSPFLLLFSVVFFSPIPELLEKQNQGGVVACSVMVILCLAGLLALWHVPLVGRIVSGIIGIFCCWYVVDQCIINFSGSWAWGGRKSAASPVNSILAFLAFGLPCCIYTIFGRFTVRKETDEESEFDMDDEFDDGEFDQTNQTDEPADVPSTSSSPSRNGSSSVRVSED